MPDQAIAVFGDAADLAHPSSAQLVKPIRTHHGRRATGRACAWSPAAERKRVVLDELHCSRDSSPARRAAEIHPLDHDVAQPQVVGPAREDLHNRRLMGGHADEVHGGLLGRGERPVRCQRWSDNNIGSWLGSQGGVGPLLHYSRSRRIAIQSRAIVCGGKRLVGSHASGRCRSSGRAAASRSPRSPTP